MINKYIALILFFIVPACLPAQKQKADSLENLLTAEKTDTGKVKLMWQLAGVISVNDPERGLLYVQYHGQLSQSAGTEPAPA